MSYSITCANCNKPTSFAIYADQFGCCSMACTTRFKQKIAAGMIVTDCPDYRVTALRVRIKQLGHQLKRAREGASKP